MLKYITGGVAATALAIGSYGFNQYHAIYVELNQAQAQVRDERARNLKLTEAAQNVVSSVAQLQEAIAQDSDKATPADAVPSGADPAKILTGQADNQ